MHVAHTLQIFVQTLSEIASFRISSLSSIGFLCQCFEQYVCTFSEEMYVFMFAFLKFKIKIFLKSEKKKKCYLC